MQLLTPLGCSQRHALKGSAVNSYPCPYCGELLLIAEHAEGSTIPCSRCRAPVDVPRIPTTRIESPPPQTPARALEDDLEGFVPKPRPLAVASPKAMHEAFEDAPDVIATRRLRRLPVKEMACLAGLGLAAGGLAWWFAGAQWLVVFLSAVGCGAGVCLGYAAWLTVRGADMRGVPPPALWGLGLGGVALFGLWVHLEMSNTVYLDNFTDMEVILEVDGGDTSWLPAKSTQTVRMRQGNHVLTLYAADHKEVDRMEVEVEGRRPFVLNVLGAQTYLRGKVYYSAFPSGDAPSEEVKLRDKWIKADVNALFAGPPSSLKANDMTVRNGIASRTYLIRQE
jgi:hypothetical protein